MQINLTNKEITFIIFALIIIGIGVYNNITHTISLNKELKLINTQNKKLIKHIDSLHNILNVSAKNRDSINNIISKTTIEDNKYKNNINTLENKEGNLKQVISLIPQDSLLIILKQKYVEDSIFTIHNK